MRRTAFSLVELSIVLVILGLLVGGVLSGQSLIHASELRAVTAEYQRYVTAYNSFVGKYFATPGDMNNATQFWGSAGGTGSDFACQSTVSTTAATCNGNGDGFVGWPTSSIPGGTPNNTVATYASELTRFWQQLANAGLIEGQYNGVSSNVSSQLYFPQPYTGNSPRSKINAFWIPSGLNGQYTGDTNTFPFNIASVQLTLNDGNNLYIGYPGDTPLFVPADAWNIDTKLDDGLPNQGKITSDKTNCSTVSGIAPPGDANGKYDLTQTTKVCGMYFSLR